MSDLFLDIGGTKIRYLVKDGDKPVDKGVGYTRNVDLVNFLEELIGRYSVDDFVGISFAGQVVGNRIVSAPNIEVPKVDIAAHLKEKFGVEVAIENDLKCAAIAEYEHRSGSPEMLVALFIGSGIGSACVYRGKLIRGKHNLAGEIGHVHFKESPFVCGCGNRGCVELYSSGTGIKRWFEYLKIDVPPTLESLKSMDEAREVRDNFYEGLSLVTSVIMRMFDPDVIILGGGVVDANPDLVDYISGQAKRFAFLGSVEVQKSELEDAPLMGAQLLKRGDLYG